MQLTQKNLGLILQAGNDPIALQNKEPRYENRSDSATRRSQSAVHSVEQRQLQVVSLEHKDFLKLERWQIWISSAKLQQKYGNPRIKS